MSFFGRLPRENLAEPDKIDIGSGTSLDLLQAVYRNSAIPLSVRMRAAGMAIPFESPKLIATAVVSGEDFATLLDRRLKRIEEQRLIEAKPANGEKLISTDSRLPARTVDRRFRRRF